ncbi:MAG: beta-N-acetylglucosaminidase domain-containing protein [Phycisphaerae bacterium]|nr:beta-N-acetylglucosaminidase domain-containing protein [Phycisphaerae bacterium]
MLRMICAMLVLAAGFTHVCHGQTPAPAVADWAGADFAGGAKERFGSLKDGESVNYVYAEPTGADAAMQHTFSIAAVPDAPMFVHVKGRDDDGPAPCRIAIELNGTTLFEGENTFSAGAWQVKRFAIPAAALKAGENTLVIANREKAGTVGMPPWFMVAACVIGPKTYVIRRDVTRDFFVTLPTEKRELPEPLPAGRKPGFAIRGTKGWNWTSEQYLAEIPVLKRFKMNFLMNCYLTTFVQEPKMENRWYEPLPDETRRGLEKVIKACQAEGIDFCFAVHPQLWSPRPIDPTSEADFELLWPHFAWAQKLGVKWFSLPLDDVHAMQGVKIDASEHAKLINRLIDRLRANDPKAELIFCPTWYWGDGTGKEQKPYLETLARELHKDVYLFWTGDAVVGNITRKGAETFRGLAQHRIVLWDNYPVNDAHPTMHLAPVTHRDLDLCDVIDGYMSNPLCQQNEANRLPMLTCADYAWNPAAYDPARSIGQAILHLAETPAQRDVMRDLVEAYPGMLIYGNGPGFNAVRHKLAQITTIPHSKQAATAFIEHMQSLARRIGEAFPNGYVAERKTLENDIAELQKMYTAKYGQ